VVAGSCTLDSHLLHTLTTIYHIYVAYTSRASYQFLGQAQRTRRHRALSLFPPFLLLQAHKVIYQLDIRLISQRHDVVWVKRLVIEIVLILVLTLPLPLLYERLGGLVRRLGV
jgi:hypothetical protein